MSILLKTWFRLPFSALIRDLLEIYNVSLGQIIPQVSRVLSVVEIIMSCDNPITLQDLMYSYEVRVKKHRLSLHVNAGMTMLV